MPEDLTSERSGERGNDFNHKCGLERTDMTVQPSVNLLPTQQVSRLCHGQPPNLPLKLFVSTSTAGLKSSYSTRVMRTAEARPWLDGRPHHWRVLSRALVQERGGGARSSRARYVPLHVMSVARVVRDDR